MPPPIDWSFVTSSRNTSATTHIPIANCPPRRRNTSSDTGSDTTPANSAPRTAPTNGLMPCSAATIVAYAPMPMNACWPTETSPAKPAMTFHIAAMMISTNSSVSFSVVFWVNANGMNASSTSSTPALETNTREPFVHR